MNMGRMECFPFLVFLRAEFQISSCIFRREFWEKVQIKQWNVLQLDITEYSVLLSACLWRGI